VEILMTTVSSQAARDVASELAEQGHVIRTCANDADPDAPTCAALRDERCPLEKYPIDAAVDVCEVNRDDVLANGGLCVVRRRIPLVLVDRPADRLAPWASASIPRSSVAATIASLESAELPGHTAEARHMLSEEAQPEKTAQAVGVVVRRRNGGLVVELSPHSKENGGDIKKVAVHVAQRLRIFDPWAKTIDVSTPIRSKEPLHALHTRMTRHTR